MRKIIILLLLLCIHFSARGQTQYEYHYWFDGDITTVEKGSTTSDAWRMEVDLSRLTESFHTIHLQVTDEKGVSSSPVTRCFFLSREGGPLTNGYYWFDNETQVREVERDIQGTMTFDVTELPQGFHALHYQVLRADGLYSQIETRSFYKLQSDQAVGQLTFMCYVDGSTFKQERLSAEHGAAKWILDVSDLPIGFHKLQVRAIMENGASTTNREAFFLRSVMPSDLNAMTCLCSIDGKVFKQETMEATNGSAIWQLDVSELPIGFHKIQFRAVMENGASTSIREAFFLRAATEAEQDSLICICSIDGKVFKQETLQTTNGGALWQLDVSELPIGFHKLQLRAMMGKGGTTSIREAFFLRNAMDSELEALSCVFSIDGQPYKTVEGGVHEGVFHCDLDVAALSDGLHKIAYILTNGKGDQTTLKSQYFVKQPVGGNSIKMYQYWLNDKDDMAHTVKQEKVTDPLQLISLLPVESQPLRSSLFHFEAKDGKPMIYAKNDIHFRFYDNSGRWVDADDQFIDYALSHKVEPVGELQPKQTFNKVGDNVIRWYTMQAAPGDTAAFKLSQAATLQVFAPSGKEVFKTSESESVKWTGIHTWEDGTYYVAVHDVTGSQNTMTLDYMHMDKYDVVDWDVHTVGNGGCSTITFKGNGFRDLYAVDLYNAQGDTVKHAAICHTSDAESSVTFNFTNAIIGKYDAVFHFATEDKSFLNILTIEEAKWIDLILDVNYPSSFLRGTSTTYTITVTNKGNATAYNIPMEIYLKSGNSFDNVQSVTIKDEIGNSLGKTFIDIAEIDSIGDETLSYVNDLIGSLNDKSSFWVINDSTYGEYGYTDQLITVPPYGKVKFSVIIEAQSTVTLKARIPSDWMTVHTSTNTYLARRTKSNKHDWCCEKEAWECKVNIWANVIGMIPVAGCASGLVDLGTFTTFEIACADGHSLGTKELDFYDSLAKDANKRKSLIERGVSGLIGCVSGAIGKAIEKLVVKLNAVKKARSAAWAAYGKASVAADEAKTNAAICQKRANDFWKNGDYDNYRIWQGAADEASIKASKFAEEASQHYKEQQELSQEIGNLLREIDDYKKQLSELIDAAKNGISAIRENSECTKKWNYAKSHCPPDPDGGSSTPVISYDPNDIYGYLSEAGSKFMADSVARVNYTIEFENDATFATASAHTIVIRDTLDSRYFDRSVFAPTGVRIGEHEVFLEEKDIATKNGRTTFVKTIDMRPEINVIAQVEGEYSPQTGIATWTFTSLDPMTMEPTDDLMQGILPVNYNGTSGIGEVMFEVGMKPNKADGTEVKNRAGIVFDYEKPIMTPAWVNTVDAVAPTSVITDVTMENDTIARLHVTAEDNLSGIWYYDVYAQYGKDAMWVKVGERVTEPHFDFRVYEDIDYGYCVLAVDSAGNAEKKEIDREWPKPETPVGIQDSDMSPTSDNEPLYDLQGRPALPIQKGIYVQRGKKRVIKGK